MDMDAENAKNLGAEDVRLVNCIYFIDDYASVFAVFQKRMTPCTYLSRKFPTRSKRIDVIARFLFPMGEN